MCEVKSACLINCENQQVQSFLSKATTGYLFKLCVDYVNGSFEPEFWLIRFLHLDINLIVNKSIEVSEMLEEKRSSFS